MDVLSAHSLNTSLHYIGKVFFLSSMKEVVWRKYLLHLYIHIVKRVTLKCSDHCKVFTELITTFIISLYDVIKFFQCKSSIRYEIVYNTPPSFIKSYITLFRFV